jgi:hypothetical protein
MCKLMNVSKKVKVPENTCAIFYSKIKIKIFIFKRLLAKIIKLPQKINFAKLSTSLGILELNSF